MGVLRHLTAFLGGQAALSPSDSPPNPKQDTDSIAGSGSEPEVKIYKRPWPVWIVGGEPAAETETHTATITTTITVTKTIGTSADAPASGKARRGFEYPPSSCDCSDLADVCPESKGDEGPKWDVNADPDKYPCCKLCVEALSHHEDPVTTSPAEATDAPAEGEGHGGPKTWTITVTVPGGDDHDGHHGGHHPHPHPHPTGGYNHTVSGYGNHTHTSDEGHHHTRPGDPHHTRPGGPHHPPKPEVSPHGDPPHHGGGDKDGKHGDHGDHDHDHDHGKGKPGKGGHHSHSQIWGNHTKSWDDDDDPHQNHHSKHHHSNHHHSNHHHRNHTFTHEAEPTPAEASLSKYKSRLASITHSKEHKYHSHSVTRTHSTTKPAATGGGGDDDDDEREIRTVTVIRDEFTMKIPMPVPGEGGDEDSK